MENQNLGRHHDRVCTEDANKKTPNRLRLIYPISQNNWDIFERIPYWVSVAIHI